MCRPALLLLLTLSPIAIGQTLTARIDGLRNGGKQLHGSYMQNPGAGGFVWYFSTRGVHSLALDGKHDKEVQAYLDIYLGTATVPGGSIDDIESLLPVVKKKVADSDDAYAGTILSLASYYATRPGGQKWFEQKLPDLEHLATANLVDNIDPKSKLPNTFHSFNGRDKLLPKAKQAWLKIGQTMDACEAYRGLKDFADQLTRMKHQRADTYHKAADKIADGVKGMFEADKGGFRVNTTMDAPGTKFYPDRVIQVAPQVFGVPLGNAKQTDAMYAAAWKYARAGGDKWELGVFPDGTNDGKPFMILAQAAVLQGDSKMANAHLTLFTKTLKAKGTKPEYGTIHELGWALLAERTLAQMR